MRTDHIKLAYAYLRLSVEEADKGESSSITNQRAIIKSYCNQNGITLLKEFVDDGYSGGNFDRPGFRDLISELTLGKANIVITKDLSRLGRDMVESSYYAERYLPEHGIRYIAIMESFDSEHDNITAPFLFAMNEVYLRDGSRKVKEVLKNKRANGEYCCCPPYGYKKDTGQKGHLVPDENTAPVVQRIYNMAANGDSSRKIAMALNQMGVIPPLKYRVLYRDEFTERGAERASDDWNSVTIKRILKNPVYLGTTILGKTRKASIKSKKKVAVPRDEWVITENTHEPLISEELYERAQFNLGRASKDFRQYDHVRKSIFSGVAFCEKCGSALCSCGTVYKGEREKYWYLSCTHQRKDAANYCSGVRIRYEDLMELVKQDLNSFIAMSDEEIDNLVNVVLDDQARVARMSKGEAQKESIESKLDAINTTIARLYLDNAEGRLSDERLVSLIEKFEQESKKLQDKLGTMKIDEARILNAEDNYSRFFGLIKQYTQIDVLTRDILTTFVDRIEVGPKMFDNGRTKATHRNQPFKQSVRIFYKFIGEVKSEPISEPNEQPEESVIDTPA